MIRHLVNLFLFLLPPARLFFLRRMLLRFSGVVLGRGVKFCGRSWIYGRGNVKIGKETWLSPGVIIYTHTDADILIGERCDIGPEVKFIIGSHQINGKNRRAGNGIARSIKIGNGCWIGAGVVILDGITVGEGCIIAAGSVVSRDIKDHVLVAGVPAIVKRQLIL